MRMSDIPIQGRETSLNAPDKVLHADFFDGELLLPLSLYLLPSVTAFNRYHRF
jgi:hypothetical protein